MDMLPTPRMDHSPVVGEGPSVGVPSCAETGSALRAWLQQLKAGLPTSLGDRLPFRTDFASACAARAASATASGLSKSKRVDIDVDVDAAAPRAAALCPPAARPDAFLPGRSRGATAASRRAPFNPLGMLRGLVRREEDATDGSRSPRDMRGGAARCARRAPHARSRRRRPPTRPSQGGRAAPGRLGDGDGRADAAATAAAAPAGTAAAGEPAAQPPPKGPRLTASHYGYTHPGGSKPLSAKNQDTWFAFKIDDHNQVWGVLDGHGSDNGTLVAEVCASVLEAYVREHFDRLRSEAEAVLHEAFERAHDAARTAVLRSDDNFKLAGDGVVVDEWEDETGELVKDAVDGGTTATLAVLLDGATFVCAMVGDSSALVGGALQRRAADRASGAPPSEWVAFADVIEEHAPTNLKEYERLTASGSRGALARFVYDVPDLIETPDELPAIFRRNLGAGRARHELDDSAIERTAELGIAPKNMRGDLPAILLTPKHDDAYPGLELPLTLAMTRSARRLLHAHVRRDVEAGGRRARPQPAAHARAAAAASHGSGAAGGGDEPLEPDAHPCLGRHMGSLRDSRGLHGDREPARAGDRRRHRRSTYARRATFSRGASTSAPRSSASPRTT